MSVMNFFVLTGAQRTTAMGFNGNGVDIDPRAIDNSSPGVGVNLNDNAADYAPGDIVTLGACYAAPKRIIDTADYQQQAPGMVAFLLTLPFCTLETETIFAPALE